MSEQVFVVWGCSGLRWARLDQGPFGPHWETGSFGSWVGLGPRLRFGLGSGPPEAGELRVALAPLLDEADLQRPSSSFTGMPVIEPLDPQACAPIAAPSAQELAQGLADWVSEQLGAGVLLVRRAWRAQGDLLEEQLRPWASRGWRFGTVEGLLESAGLSTYRLLTTDGALSRYEEPGSSRVLPNGPEAALAAAWTPLITGKLLQLAGPDAQAWWRQEGETRVGWVLRQQLVSRLTQALKAHQPELILGGVEAPVFATCAGLDRRIEDLAAVRVLLRLPAIRSDYWERLGEDGFLSGAAGPGEPVLWSRPTLEIESPDERADLTFFLSMRGHPRKSLQLRLLHEHFAEGEPLNAWFAHSSPEPLLPPPPEPLPPVPELDPIVSPEELGSLDQPMPVEVVEELEAHEPAPEPEPPELELPAPEGPRPFHPQELLVPLPHRPESLRLVIDGQVVDATLVSLGPAEGGTRYLVEQPSIPHGAAVRLDFEPTWRRP
jgi:hypothetical protein